MTGAPDMFDRRDDQGIKSQSLEQVKTSRSIIPSRMRAFCFYLYSTFYKYNALCNFKYNLIVA